MQHLPIPVVLTDARGFIVGASVHATTLLHCPASVDELHLDAHLQTLTPQPSAERTVIACDAGPHDLVVLSPAGDATAGTPADVAQLAGEVAHDFNNLLGVIINYATLAAADAPEDSQQARDLAEVLTASRRAATIADRLRRMSVSGETR